MSPEFFAQLTLVVFAAIAVALILRDVFRWGIGWRIWFLYFLVRTYGAFFFHPRFKGRCPFPDDGPALIIANHRSPIDPLVIWVNHHLGSRSGRIRMIRFMMAREYLEVRLVGWITRTAKVIPTDRDGQDLGSARAALRLLKAGKLVCLFPEGRINLGKDLLDASPGIAWLALRGRVPVYPVYVQGTRRGGSMIEPFSTFCRATVNYGEPIDLSEYYGRRKSQELLREVTDKMMRQLAELGGVNATPTAAPEDSPTVEFPRATG